ncbi:unnamed protein product [Brugia pahangi]|uniref:Uncharacterized protein n=1 Tax=Brugia pahangi TaxID=6280 RepID=A0A0N4TX77_BRUPA|nr:unnamed protein product [Brugia pahangi]
MNQNCLTNNTTITAATTITATTTTTTTDDAVAKMNEPNLKSNGISGKNKIYQ